MSEPISCLNGYEIKDAAAREAITERPPYITPEMYGAVGDGVADDSVALQAAINYCISNDVPMLGSGKYLFSQGLVIDNTYLSQTPKISFAGDLKYTGEDFAFTLSGWYINLTLNGNLDCSAGCGIKICDKDGSRWTAFNKVSFFAITTQGNGIEIYAKKNGTYNNEIHGTNITRFGRGTQTIVEDDSCGIKLYRGDGDSFVSENTLDIRWISYFHYGQYHERVFDNRVLHTSFEINGVGIAVIDSNAFIQNPRLGELRWGYYLDGEWSIAGNPGFNLCSAKFGENIVPAPKGANIAKGYNTFSTVFMGKNLHSKGGIYIPAGCRQAWAFNLDDVSVTKTAYPANKNAVYMNVDYVDEDPATIVDNPEIAMLPARNFYLSTGKTGDIVLSRMFYNYYNINSVEITVEGTYPEDRHIYYGDGTLLLTIPKDSVWGYNATIKWEKRTSVDESGKSVVTDEAAFTPTVTASWLTE